MPIVFEKDKDLNEYVVTCPILDICSQGSTKKEAEKNIREAVGLFLLSCIERDTLNEVLKECDKQLTDTVYPENKHDDDDKLGVYEYCDNCGFSVDDDNYCGCCDTYNK